MKKLLPKLVFVSILIVLAVMFIYYDLQNYLTLSYLKQHQHMFHEYYSQNKIQTLAIYFILYIVTTALSFPGATILSLAAGACFGLVIGVIIVSFASTIGATLAFLSSRYLFKDYIQRRFKKQIEPINVGIEKDGAMYLFSLRLIPIFPFFVINLVMGITKIKVLKFFFVSQLGMFAATVLFVNAGLQLGSINSLGDILSFKLMGSFALLGIFPILVKKLF